MATNSSLTPPLHLRSLLLLLPLAVNSFHFYAILASGLYDIFGSSSTRRGTVMILAKTGCLVSRWSYGDDRITGAW
jgi:hypothetical protein